MATSFDDVIDLALVIVDDYKLVKLYKQGEEGFRKWCDSFLIKSIPKFKDCRQSLEYDEIKREFVSDLTNSEIDILADLWAMTWFTRETQDSTRINALLQTSGSFKTHAASQNLKEKSDYLDKLREKISQDQNDYELEDLDSYGL